MDSEKPPSIEGSHDYSGSFLQPTELLHGVLFWLRAGIPRSSRFGLSDALVLGGRSYLLDANRPR